MGGRGHERRREGSGRGSCGSSERAGVAARGTRGRKGRIWVGRWKSPERQPGSSSGHLDVSRDPTQRGKPEAGSGGRRNSALSLLSQEALAPPAPSSGHRPTAGRSEPIGLGRPWRFGRESGAPGWLRTTPASMPFRVGGTLERIHHVAQPLLFQVRTPRSRGRRPFSAPGRKSCACCVSKQSPNVSGLEPRCSLLISCLFNLRVAGPLEGLLFVLLLFQTPG